VSMPNDPAAPPTDQNVKLAIAPSNPREFQVLALKMAEILRPDRKADEAPAVPDRALVSEALEDGNGAP
jgi:hypothetical protein